MFSSGRRSPFHPPHSLSHPFSRSLPSPQHFCFTCDYHAASHFLSFSPFAPLFLSPQRFRLCPAVWYRESFRAKRKHFDFQRNDRGQRKLVDHTDVDRAIGTNLHTWILTNFSSAWRRFRLPSLAPLHLCISNGFMEGRRSTTVFPGPAGLSRDLAEIRNVRSGKICSTNSRDRAIVSRATFHVQANFNFRLLLYAQHVAATIAFLCRCTTAIIYQDSFV